MINYGSLKHKTYNVYEYCNNYNTIKCLSRSTLKEHEKMFEAASIELRIILPANVINSQSKENVPLLCIYLS